jgi:uroporphyrinogen decarboxylase
LLDTVGGIAPTIHFGTNTTTLLPLMRQAGGDVIGMDWRVPLDQGWDIIGHDRAVQGNLDPTILLGPQEEIRLQAGRILHEAAGKPGHIFNLGHGILPMTPVENVKYLVEVVRNGW